MTDKVAITVKLGDEEPLVEFLDEGMAVSLPLSQVDGRLYRVDGVPVMVEAAAFGDIVELVPDDDGRLRFVRVVEQGGWRTFGYILSSSKIDSDEGQSLLQELEQRGGHWEHVFGGLLFICIPPDLDLDPTPWVALAKQDMHLTGGRSVESG